jgi:hypothetical protein
MKTRATSFVAVGVCLAISCGSLAVWSGAAGAAKPPAVAHTTAKVPSVTGIWKGFAPASSGTPIWMFILTNKPGSAGVTRHITGEWEALDGGGDVFTDPGTIDPSTGKALLVAGGGQRGVTQTTNFTVKFVFKSNSTARTNHPTFSGSYDYVNAATGQENSAGGSVRAVRCSAKVTKAEIQRCR